jgi:hypothetical protein
MLSSILVILASLLFAGGCLFYAATRGMRTMRGAWWVMSIPLFFHAGIYAWILFVNPSPEARIFPVRMVTIVEQLVGAFLTILLGTLNVRKNGN